MMMKRVLDLRHQLGAMGTAALVMLAAWRGSTLAVTRAKYQPSLHDSERQRARAGASQSRPSVQPGSSPAVRTGSGGSSER